MTNPQLVRISHVENMESYAYPTFILSCKEDDYKPVSEVSTLGYLSGPIETILRK